MTTKWHYNVIASATAKALAHLPAAVGAETGWQPASSLTRAKRSAASIAHAFAQLTGDMGFEPCWRRVSPDRYEASSSSGEVHVIVARAGSCAGETDATHGFRRGVASK